jgi:DNA repair protein REV1
MSAKKPLNITGTQFIMPTQIDPTVLAELPQDVRSKLLAQSKSAPTSRAQSPVVKSRSQSPTQQIGDAYIPSQLDTEVFDALPEDVKAEVLASYNYSRNTTSRAQSLLPQSPRKLRVIPPSRKPTTPTKKRTGLLFRGRNSKQDANSTLTQSNFVTSLRAHDSSKLKDTNTDSDDSHTEILDPDFLSALPPDVRAEVLAEHRRTRLARLGLAKPQRKNPSKPAALPPGQRRLRLPPRPKKPTFTTAELSTLPQLRDTLSAWHREFLEEGPHVEDVGAMERYLRRVVLEERDMSKAVGVVRWLGWLIENEEEREDGGNGDSGKEKRKAAWLGTLEGLRETVQAAVRERGLGKVDFD